MREILFKAKSLETGKWIEGYYVYYSKNILKDDLHMIVWGKNFQEWDEVDPETVCQYTGKKIFQNQVTVEKPTEPVKVWQDDLIAIYTIYYDDDDKPARNKIAVIRVEFDETYQIMYAKCVYGTMEGVVSECDIEYMDGSEDWPFTFWIEYMENARSQYWECEVIGNIHDEED